MFKILLYKLGLYQKYVICYHDLYTYNMWENETEKEYRERVIKTIDFYYFKNCPKFILEENALLFLKNRVNTCVSNLILIYSIGDIKYNELGKYFKF